MKGSKLCFLNIVLVLATNIKIAKVREVHFGLIKSLFINNYANFAYKQVTLSPCAKLVLASVEFCDEVQQILNQVQGKEESPDTIVRHSG